MDDVDDEMKTFLRYVEDSTETVIADADSSWLKELHRHIIRVKSSKEVEVLYMTLLEHEQEKFEEGKAEGLREGKAEGEKLSKLTRILLDAKEYDLLREVTSDTELRKKLYDKYKIN